MCAARSSASMMTFLNTFRRVGGAFEIDDEGIRFWHPGGPLNAIALETDVHPGFQTDWQQPLVVALTQASGLSIVHETVYESRLGFTSALNQMGAHIQLYRECLGGSDCRFGQRNFLHSAVVSRPDQAPGRRPGHSRPARRLLVPDRGAGGPGHLPGARHRPDQPRLRELHGEAAVAMNFGRRVELPVRASPRAPARPGPARAHLGPLREGRSGASTAVTHERTGAGASRPSLSAGDSGAAVRFTAPVRCPGPGRAGRGLTCPWRLP